jgi:selenide,water dikinase
LSQLPKHTHPNLLVGVETGDDAAIYQLSDDVAVIQTVDFFPPIVDDPYTYGQIAVANSLSDVYAMGGKPILALNIVGFPVTLDKQILTDVLRGGYDKAAEANVVIAGGHTVDDPEPKYGLAVTGVIKPGEQITNAGAMPGDGLILTKPIGTGIITTAGKAKLAPQSVIDGAVRVMAELNAKAAEAMLEVGVHSCTDITGFGLIGHLNGMTNGSKVAARLHLSKVPVFDGVWDLLAQDTAPGGTHRNLKSALAFTRWDDSISEDAKLLLCDAQTSGGLLLSVAPDKIGSMMNALEARGVMGVNIGEILESSEPYIEIVA